MLGVWGVMLLALPVVADTLARESLPQPPPQEAEDDAILVAPPRRAMYDGMMAAQAGQYEEAIAKLEWAIAEDPTLFGAWQTLGWVYWLTGRRDDAETLWQRLVTIASDEPMGYNLLAQVALQDANLMRARELYETSLRLNPDQYEIRKHYANALLRTGETERAQSLFEALLREDPDRIDVEIDLAWTRYVNEDYEGTLVHWDRIIDFLPDNAGFLLARANVLTLLGSLFEAETDARRALELEPRNYQALNLLATIAMRARRPQETVEMLQRVLDYAEDDRAKATIALQIASYKRAVYETAPTVFSRRQILDAIQTSMDYDDDNVVIHMFLGEALILDRQFARAERVFRNILETYNPNNSRALNGLVESYFGRSMLDEAERQLRENERLFNPDNPFRHAFWARLYFARGRLADALERLDRLEHEGAQGAVFSLLYHGINPSEFSDMPSERQLREHLMTLRRHGFRFVVPSELDDLFARKQAPPLRDPRPLLVRGIEALRYALSGEPREVPQTLNDYSPPLYAMVTFDDGMRNSFRYGTRVAQDLGIRAAMFMNIAYSVAPERRTIASFQETRDFLETGVWEIHSHLWDGHDMVLNAEEGRRVLPVPNLRWLSEKERMESLREYHARLRREFRDSRRVLIRELELDEADVFAVAYPFGEVGQETETNINLFNVPDVVLNEAETAYRMGFIQHMHGYTMATDNPMLYKRWEPDRMHSGRDVLRHALRQHPVFTARRMRVEMAAYSGELHMALENIERLRRDGYPEEEVAELNEFVRQRLGRLMQLPEAVEDQTAPDEGETPWVSLRTPYLGIEGTLTRANEMIDDREVSVFAGLNLNRRLGLQVRYGEGNIRQTVRTNAFVEIQRTTVSTQQSTEQRIEGGEVSDVQVNRTIVSTDTVVSNVVRTTRHRADKSFLGLSLNYTHANGSFTLANARLYTLDGTDIDDASEWTFGIEHQWRPVLAIDLAANYQRGLVPSAREIISYDSVGLNGIWRVRDGWHAGGFANYAFFRDRNSLVRGQIENFWRLSRPYDFWFGLEHSLETVDRDSVLYWSPYWDQRHVAILRLRRAYPNFFWMFRANLGIRKRDIRREELDAFETARARGEVEGWSPGSGPDRDWSRLLGFSGTVTRTFANGIEASGQIAVNTSGEYTENTAGLRLMYRF